MDNQPVVPAVVDTTVQVDPATAQPPIVPVVDVSVTPTSATVDPQSAVPQTVTVVRGSGSMKLTKADAEPIIRGLMIALGGAALTYATKVITGHDFGVYTPLVVVLWSAFVNAARIWIGNNNKIVPIL